jgi:hypothetical protein
MRKLQAFGSEILDLQAQAPDRVYVALADGKIMVLDRLLVKHVLRCAQPILQSVSGVTLQKQKLFLLPHESCIRCLCCSSARVLSSQNRVPHSILRCLVFPCSFCGPQCVGWRWFAALRHAAP